MQPKSMPEFASLAARRAPELTLEGQASGFAIETPELAGDEYTPTSLPPGQIPIPPIPPLDEELRGTDGADPLSANEAESVFGLGGADVITYDFGSRFTGTVRHIYGGESDTENDTFVFDSLLAAPDDRVVIDLSTGAVDYRTSYNDPMIRVAQLYGVESLSVTANRVTLTGDASNNTLRASGAIYSDLRGGEGHDTFHGSNNSEGWDYLYGEGGNDIIYGRSGRDYLSGGTGSDYLYGGGQNDTIVGGSGNDRLFGGTGDDMLTGGDDADIFVFSDLSIPTSGLDTIMDFDGTKDRLDFRGLGYGSLGELDIREEADGLHINLDDTTIVLKNVFGVLDPEDVILI